MIQGESGGGEIEASSARKIGLSAWSEGAYTFVICRCVGEPIKETVNVSVNLVCAELIMEKCAEETADRMPPEEPEASLCCVRSSCRGMKDLIFALSGAASLVS